MLPDTCTQEGPQKPQAAVKCNSGAGFDVVSLWSGLWLDPEEVGGRGRPKESLPTLLAPPTHTHLFTRGLWFVGNEHWRGFAGGDLDHMCSAQLGSYTDRRCSARGIGLAPPPSGSYLTKKYALVISGPDSMVGGHNLRLKYK